MQRTTAVLFQTHFFDRWCAKAFARLVAGCPPSYRPIVLIHLPPGAPVPTLLQGVPHHVVRTPELRAPEYPTKSGGPDWNLWEGGHTDLIFLHYVRAHPEHERYWGIEYDVRFSGEWSRFFAAYEDDISDFLAPAILPRQLDPGWYNWGSLSGPLPLPESEQLRAFLPVFRASAAMVRAVDSAYRAGWGGHCEGTWPSLAKAFGLSFCDLGGDGPFTPQRYRGRFYTSSPLAVGLAPGTFVFKPPLYRMGRRRDMLWHPVKPFFWRAELREGLRDMRRRAGIAMRGIAGLTGIALPSYLQEGAFEAAAQRRRSALAAIPDVASPPEGNPRQANEGILARGQPTP